MTTPTRHTHAHPNKHPTATQTNRTPTPSPRRRVFQVEVASRRRGYSKIVVQDLANRCPWSIEVAGMLAGASRCLLRPCQRGERMDRTGVDDARGRFLGPGTRRQH